MLRWRMASVHLEKGGRQVSGRRVAFQRAPGRHPERGWVYRQEPLRASALPEASARGGWHSQCAEQGAGLAGTTGRRLRSRSAPQPRSLGRCGLGRRCHRHCCCFCAGWATASSTGLCCAPGGLACSQTGRCVPWNGPIHGRGAPRCRSWNLEQARPSSSPAGQ